MARIWWLLRALSAAAVVWTLMSPSQSHAQDVITFGIDPTFQPLAFHDDDGNLVGFEIDLIEAMAEHMDAEAEIEPMAWDGLIPALQAGRIDIQPEMAMRPARQEQVDFTPPFFCQTNTVVMRIERNDFNPESAEDLKGERIGVGAGTSSDILVSEMPDLDITRYNTVPDAFREVTLGRIDLVAADSLSAGYMVQHTFPGQLRVSEKSLTGQVPIGAALRKGNTELLERLNDAIEGMNEDGSLVRIVEKWFGKYDC